MSKKKESADVLESEVLMATDGKTGKSVPIEVLTVEETVKPQLAIFDAYEARYLELKNEYGSVKINGIKDTEGYDAAKIAVRELRTTRTGSEDDRKTAKSFYLECGRAIDKKAQWIEDKLLELEIPIKAQIKAIDDEKDRIKQERIQAEIERSKVRVAELKKLGVEWDGENYTLDDISFSAETIRESPDDHFNEKIIPQFKAIADAKEKIAKANREAQELLERQQEESRKELERQQQKLKDDQRKLKDLEDKIELDKKRAVQERTKKRSAYLVGLGFEYDIFTDLFELNILQVHIAFVSGADEEKWEQSVAELLPQVELAKQRIKEIAEREQKEHDEKIRLKAIEDQKEKDRLEALKKQEEYERSTDKQKYLNFVQELNGVEFPILVSKHFKAKLSIIREKLEEINSL